MIGGFFYGGKKRGPGGNSLYTVTTGMGLQNQAPGFVILRFGEISVQADFYTCMHITDRLRRQLSVLKSPVGNGGQERCPFQKKRGIIFLYMQKAKCPLILH